MIELMGDLVSILPSMACPASGLRPTYLSQQLRSILGLCCSHPLLFCCCLATLAHSFARSLALRTAFPPLFLLRVKIHTAIAVLYIYSSMDTPCACRGMVQEG